MLKKLFKYDMISLSRVLIIVHLILIPIIAFIVMFVVPDIEQNGVNLINICGMLLIFHLHCNRINFYHLVHCNLFL